MVTVPTMFHGRVAVLPLVAIVAAIQEGQFGFNFSSCLLRDSKSSYICNSGRALRRRRARPANNSFTKFEFNQAWLAESRVTDSSQLVAVLQNDSHLQCVVLVGSDISDGE